MRDSKFNNIMRGILILILFVSSIVLVFVGETKLSTWNGLGFMLLALVLFVLALGLYNQKYRK